MKSIAIGLGVALAALVAAAATFGLWLTGRIGGPDKAEYTARNEQVLDSLPAFPGASLSRTSSREQRNRPDWPETFGPPTGWTTTRVYSVPERRSWAEIRSFYLGRMLPAWSLRSLSDNDVVFVRRPIELWIGRGPEGFAVQVDRDCGLACEGVRTPGGDEIVVELRPLGDSPLSGVATLRASGSDTIVEIAIAPRVDGAVAHLHEGPCTEREGRRRPAFRLNETSNGDGIGPVAASVSRLRAGGYSIDVHAPGSTQRLAAACGSIR